MKKIEELSADRDFLLDESKEIRKQKRSYGQGNFWVRGEDENSITSNALVNSVQVYPKERKRLLRPFFASLLRSLIIGLVFFGYYSANLYYSYVDDWFYSFYGERITSHTEP